MKTVFWVTTKTLSSNMMDPVTSQPSFGFEDQGIFGGQKPVLSGLEKLSKVNELKVHHGRLTCVEGNLKKN